MLPSFEKLIRMLIQEKRLGYQNKAIMGGFEKLAPNWADDAIQECEAEDQRTLVVQVKSDLMVYHTLSEDDRPRFLHNILVRLHKVSESAGEASPADTDPEPKAPPKIRSRSRPKKSTVQPPAQEKPEAQDTPEPPAEPPNEAQAETVVQVPELGEESAPPPRKERKPSKPKQSKTRRTQPRAAPLPASTDAEMREFFNTGLESPVTRLPGIKEAYAQKLEKLGVYSIGDFLTLYPRRYDDYRSLKAINQLQYGEEVTIIAHVWETRKRETKPGRAIVTATLSDGTANIEVTWFNQPWLVDKLKPGTQIVVSGRVEEYLGRLVFNAPDWEELDANLVHTGRIVPVYPLTQGITAKWLRMQIKRAIDYWTPRLTDNLPVDMVERLELLSLSEAIQQVHFPDDLDRLELARRRLAFDELLLIQLGVLRQKQTWQQQQGQAIAVNPDDVARVVSALPFTLTDAQKRSLDDVVADLQRDVPMSRLLQGDVGSGKTVVALAAMVLTTLSGAQTAILAPTEILAEQHHKSMATLLEAIGTALDRPFTIRILTGSTPAAQRREILAGLADGSTNILVGTHAIIQDDVEFQQLQFAVVDEQHRFGVRQRNSLRSKGINPHMLVMTATPIPRSLALTLYGDLDLSVIDELPPGRQAVDTRWLLPTERERAYSFIQSKINEGRQAFIICPLVEESDKLEAKSAVAEHKRLQNEIFPQLKLGLLHGRLKAQEKETVMRSFRDGEITILVSTSVVEVGIDVPNATVILIEGANRFGLAQLHQFRGRVGRGEHQSYCLLLADNASPEAQDRLAAVESTTNGFELAEHDLRLRGPGEFFGTRQSGLPDLKLVKLSDTRLLDLARREAQHIITADPDLGLHQSLKQQLEKLWKAEGDLS